MWLPACPGSRTTSSTRRPGRSSVDDIAGYSDDPAREREVLEDYGYRFGWERFWGEGSDGPVTGVFVDQFETRAGAGAYAEEVARNDAERYRGSAVGRPAGPSRWLLAADGGRPNRTSG